MKPLIVVMLLASNMAFWCPSVGAADPPKPDETVGALLKIVEDPKIGHPARARAAYSLGAMGAKAEMALPALVLLYNEIPSDYRGTVAQGMDRIILALNTTPRADKTLIDFVRDLESRDESIRLRAVKVLLTMSRACLPKMAAATRDPDPDVKRLADEALQNVREALNRAEPSVVFLIEDLKSSNEVVRLAAAKQLGKMGAKAADALPGLREALNDPDEDVRRVAQVSLDKIMKAK